MPELTITCPECKKEIKLPLAGFLKQCFASGWGLA